MSKKTWAKTSSSPWHRLIRNQRTHPTHGGPPVLGTRREQRTPGVQDLAIQRGTVSPTSLKPTVEDLSRNRGTNIHIQMTEKNGNKNCLI